MNLLLRPVDPGAGDLEHFFRHQDDRAAAAMVPMAVRTREEHLRHWRKTLVRPDALMRTVVLDGRVAGNVVSWQDGDRRLVGYWLGREFWGRGVASGALALFVDELAIRPLYAFVAEHNAASIRVLEKNGFVLAEVQPERQPDDVEERLYLLR